MLLCWSERKGPKLVFIQNSCSVHSVCMFCQVTGCRRRLKKRLPITISSTIIEEQPRQQRASRLEPDEPGSATAVSDVISKSRALSLSDEIITRFRRPITPGDTRQNIGFEAVLEEQEIDSSPVTTERCWLSSPFSCCSCKSCVAYNDLSSIS